MSYGNYDGCHSQTMYKEKALKFRTPTHVLGKSPKKGLSFKVVWDLHKTNVFLLASLSENV